MSENENQTQNSLPPAPAALCETCGQPLNELALNSGWSKHLNCQTCFYCGAEMPNAEQIGKCISAGRPVSHETCYQTRLFQDFKEKVLPVTQAHVDALNDEILKFYPAVNPSVDDVDVLYKMLMSLQVTAANISYALGLTKDKLRIRESQNYNHEQKQQKAAKAERQRSEQTVEIAKQAQNAERKANPDRWRAKQGFMKFLGMTEEQAETHIQKMELDARAKLEATQNKI